LEQDDLRSSSSSAGSVRGRKENAKRAKTDKNSKNMSKNVQKRSFWEFQMPKNESMRKMRANAMVP